jgi:glycosyltransferase involved in cell wall biosynthesis
MPSNYFTVKAGSGPGGEARANKVPAVPFDRPRGLHFLHVFPNFAPGGMELRVARIINGFRADVRHTILALFGNYEAKSAINGNVDVRLLEPPTRNGYWSYVWTLQNLLRSEQPDLLLTYNWGAIDAILGACGRPRQPLVHHECGFGAEEAEKLNMARVFARRVLLRRAFAVAVTSKTLHDIALAKFKVPRKKLHWIRTGIDLQRFRPSMPRDWRRDIGVREDEVLFGFVGGLRPEKNLPLLIRAFSQAQVANSRLVLMGDGAERQRLEAIAAASGVRDRVIFAGRVPDPAVCLPALDVFVLSSCTEQTSNALLEAMACGLPAVSTDVGDSAELLGGSGSPVIVPTGDVTAYAIALKTLAGSQALRQCLGLANRQRCLSRYQLDQMVTEYEELYMSACGEPASNAR